MTHASKHLVVAAFVTVVLISLPARAETLVVPWLGANTGSRNVSGVIDFGASAGMTIAGVDDDG